MVDDPGNALDYWEPEKKLADSLSPRAGAIVRYIDAVRQRAERNAEQVLDEAAAAAEIDVEELLRRIGQDERLMLLLASTLEAAQRASAEAKLTGLARALASTALQSDDATIDEAQMIISTIHDLEAPHLKALERIAVRRRPVFPSSDKSPPGNPYFPFTAVVRNKRHEQRAAGISTDDATNRLAFPIISTLQRHGLIYEQMGYSGATGEFFATAYGRRVLEVLHMDGTASMAPD